MSSCPPRTFGEGLALVESCQPISDHDDLRFDSLNGESLAWLDAIEQSHTDGLLICHRGHVIYEGYFGGCGPHVRHINLIRSELLPIDRTGSLCLRESCILIGA
ncbi:MAG: hypothetical protein OSB11_13360 [Gammaproteobacteria bacterium]|nr:hypothetical protein [Gammaproteobacteria bacterium]MDE0988163.1 hypothetical protein [Pseudomonadales bacterium]